MKKYISFFRLRLMMGLQYRTAAVAGLVTQFVWGFMYCISFRAFYETNPAAFPMDFSAAVAYVWLQQAFLSLFAAWAMDNDIFEMILQGNIAYEMCRPVSIYRMWFAKSTATRISRAALRCLPILLVAAVLPQPYRLVPPASVTHLLLTLLAMMLGLGVTVAFCLLVYISAFFTVSPQGLRILLVSATEFLSGGIIPLPFLTEPIRSIVLLLPFASMENVPLRIYSGDLAGEEMWRALGLQTFWLVALIVFGMWLCRRAEHRVVVQGG